MKYLNAIFSIDSPDEAIKGIVREVLAEELGQVGFEAFEDTPEGMKGYVQDTLFHQEDIDRVLEELPFEGVTINYQMQEMEDKDWNEAWENEGFAPIDIDGKVTIYDAKHTDDCQRTTFDTPVCIGIEARQAFGTGTHQTTRMVVRTLLNIEMEDKRLLDCGCGTGILAIVAAKLGASEVVAYDIDEWSVENTRHNAAINGVDQIEVFTGDSSVLSHINGVFDVVVANINRNILLQDMPAFKEALRTNGILVLSGFYSSDVPILVEQAQELGLTLIHQRTEDDWACVVLK